MIYDEFEWNPAIKAWRGRGGSVRKDGKEFLGCRDDTPGIEHVFDTWEMACAYAAGLVEFAGYRIDGEPEHVFHDSLMAR